MATSQKPPEDLRTFLRGDPHPELTMLVKTRSNTDALAALAPFTKEYLIPARGARYYLCQGGAYAQPWHSVSELKTLLLNMTGLES